MSAVTSERGQLINLAYRLVGSLADAEDVIQEAYARWYAMSPQQRQTIESPGAWLTTVASRICLDLLGSARARRERYVGQWLPEPVPEPTEWISRGSGGTAADPADRVTLDESVNMAFLVVLESMTAAERVAFILHDVFRYSFPEVADIVGRTPAASWPSRRVVASTRRALLPRRRRSRRASSRIFERPGPPRTSTRSSAPSIPTPRPSPTAAGASSPASCPSRAPSRSHASTSTSPTVPPTT